MGYERLLIATLETIAVVLSASVLATLFALPLALLLFAYQPRGLHVRPWCYRILLFLINIFRSIPFVILLVLLIPFTRLMVGTSIGSAASVAPLTVAAIPFLAKLLHNVFNEIGENLLEAGVALGARNWQIISYIVLPESLPGMINAVTVTAITLLGYSVMAGAIIGGGLGEIAINYGYQRFDFTTMLITVLILITLVQGLQFLGDYLIRKLTHD